MKPSALVPMLTMTFRRFGIVDGLLSPSLTDRDVQDPIEARVLGSLIAPPLRYTRRRHLVPALPPNEARRRGPRGELVLLVVVVGADEAPAADVFEPERR